MISVEIETIITQIYTIFRLVGLEKVKWTNGSDSRTVWDMKVRRGGCDYVSLWVKWPPNHDAAVSYKPKCQIFRQSVTTFSMDCIYRTIHFDICPFETKNTNFISMMWCISVLNWMLKKGRGISLILIWYALEDIFYLYVFSGHHIHNFALMWCYQ